MSEPTWRMFAQRRGPELAHFGTRFWAAQHDGDGVTAVELAEDPAGPLYAWIDNGAHGPTLVSADYAQLCRAFAAGDPLAPDPLAWQQAGWGRVVRLRARELEGAR